MRSGIPYAFLNEAASGGAVMHTIYEEFGRWAASLPDTVGAEFDPHSSHHWRISGAKESIVRTLNAYAARLFPAAGVAPLDSLLYHVAAESNYVGESNRNPRIALAILGRVQSVRLSLSGGYGRL
jgi:hypothetical protein